MFELRFLALALIGLSESIRMRSAVWVADSSLLCRPIQESEQDLRELSLIDVNSHLFVPARL
ncbi:MAG: hypothetical protein Aurels2KO_30940 [Aureliella sp.]